VVVVHDGVVLDAVKIADFADVDFDVCKSLPN
jgi:hypothetical protein